VPYILGSAAASAESPPAGPTRSGAEP